MKKTQTIHLMGTVIDLMVDSPNAEEVLYNLVKRLKIYEHRFSANDNSSELMAVNLASGKHPVKVHPELFQLIQYGKQESLAPHSYLNIAIGPLVQTWRIGFSNAKVPEKKVIDHCLTLIDPNQITLNPETQEVYLEKPGMLLDLGALAKGYIADLLVDYLKKEKVHCALLNLGGNIITFGPSYHPDTLWKIGVRRPGEKRNDLAFLLPVKNQSVVTSGIYERTLQKNGTSYHHILNPQTGYPVKTKLASLTIVSEKSVVGEMYTTKLFGWEPLEIIHYLNQLPKVEGALITQDGAYHFSDGLKDKVVL